MINFVKLWKFGNVFSILLIGISIFALYSRGMNFGIDFTGGTIIEISSNQAIDKELTIQLGENLSNNQIRNIIQVDNNNRVSIRVQSDDLNRDLITNDTKKIISNTLYSHEIKYEKIDFIGAQISKEFFKKSFYACCLSLLGIMIYMLVRFDWRFALGGIIGLIHDVIIALGFASIFKIEINMLAITALLTIIGYSINDSVIIYDRIREILKLKNRKSLIENINLSLNNTFTRTMFTSITTLLSAGILILFGGKSLYSFSTIVFIGILIGTYSSIFIASQFLVYCPTCEKIDEKTNTFEVEIKEKKV